MLPLSDLRAFAMTAAHVAAAPFPAKRARAVFNTASASRTARRASPFRSPSITCRKCRVENTGASLRSRHCCTSRSTALLGGRELQLLRFGKNSIIQIVGCGWRGSASTRSARRRDDGRVAHRHAPAAPLLLAARFTQSHGRSCGAALLIQLATTPRGRWRALFASNLARAIERIVIALIGITGICMALTNTGLMMSIMKSRFAPGLFAPLCETAAVVVAAVGGGSIGELRSRCWSDAAHQVTVEFVLKRESGKVREACWHSARRAFCVHVAGCTRRMYSEQVICAHSAWPTARSELGVFGSVGGY